MIRGLARDIQYAFRSLRKRPGFSLIVVVTLALGIGANTAIFSVVNGVLLTPLPYRNPNNLVVVSARNDKQNVTQQPLSYPTIMDLKQGNSVFEHLAAVRAESFSLTDRDEPERVNGVRVSANILTLLGVSPAIGRAFLPEEEQPAKGSVVLVGYGLWQRRYAGDRNLTGKAITIDGKPYSVIGILPPQLKQPGVTLAGGAEADVWIPVIPAANEQNRNFANMRVIGRVKNGVTSVRAKADVDTIALRLEKQYPDSNSNVRFDVADLREQLTGRVSKALWVLMGVVGCVLLIACANVANLLLARATSRQSEVAVRTAIGASRFRLIREFLSECMLLSLAGGLLGLLLAYGGVALMISMSSSVIPRADEIGINRDVLLFTLLASVLTGIVCGLVPAFQSSRSRAQGTRQHRRMLSVLVVAEIAIAIALVTGAGLMMRSFRSVLTIDTGFDPRNVLTFSSALPSATYKDQQLHLQFFDRALAKLQAIPGVQAAAGTFRIPVTGFATVIFTVQGQPMPNGQEPRADYRTISVDYFRAMGIRLVKGREFTDHDNATAPDAVIVNEELARREWPAEDPIGKRLQVGTELTRWREVVGVVGNAKLSGLEAPADPAIYIPFPQNTWPNAVRNSFIVVRTAKDPQGVIPEVRNALRSIDPLLPIAQVRTMEDILGEAVSQRRFNTALLALFAGVAAVLAIVGIYGVMSYTTTRRTREVGIRIALGAKQSDITRLVTWSGARLAVIGIGFGIVAAAVVSRWMSSLLFGVTATDPMTFALTAILSAAVTVAASYIPSRRASRINPITALRHD